MADPFSIAASAAGVVDISVKVLRFTDTIDRDLAQFVNEIERLSGTVALIQKAFEREMKDDYHAPESSTATIWSVASSALVDCKAAIVQLNTILVQIKGEDGSSTFDRLKRHFRKLSNDEEFAKLRQRLDKGHQVLQISLTALNMFVVSPFIPHRASS